MSRTRIALLIMDIALIGIMIYSFVVHQPLIAAIASVIVARYAIVEGCRGLWTMLKGNK